MGIVDAAIGRRPQQAIANLELIGLRAGVHVIVAGGYYLAPSPAGVMDKSEEQIAAETITGTAALGVRDQWHAL